MTLGTVSTLSRAELLRATTKRRITAAARVALSSGGMVTEHLIADVCEQVGVHHQAFRVFFPIDDELLDAVNDLLVDECADRLRGGVARFSPTNGASSFVEASIALAKSWPLDRGGMIIRANRRLRALQGGDSGGRVVLAERRFVGALADVLTEMMTTLERRFSWQPALAVRVILDTFERSFEAWILSGRGESEFPTSPYVQRTLPTLLEELSVPWSHVPAGRS